MFRLQQQDKGTEMAKGQGTCRDPHWAPTDLQAQPFNTHSTSGPLSRPLRGLPTHSCYLWRTEAALSWFPIAQSLSHTHCCNSNTRDAAAHFTEARFIVTGYPWETDWLSEDLWSATVDSFKSIYINDMLGTEQLPLLFPWYYRRLALKIALALVQTSL